MMDDFQSFGEFQKELHHANAPAETPAAPREEPPDGPPRRPVRRKKRRSIRKYLLAVGGGFAVCAACLLLLPIPVGDVRVYGNESMTKEDVLFDGGITAPVNVFRISTSDLESRLRQDVRVYQAEVKRTFPLYIDVTLTERKPLAAVQEEFGYAYLDKSGMVIRTGSSIRGGDLPMITGVKLDNVLLGDMTGSSQVKTALEFLSGLSPQGIHTFSEVNVGNPENIVAYTRDGIAVRLGDGSSMTARAELAENMVNDVKVRGLSVAYIDASLTSPYIRLKK